MTESQSRLNALPLLQRLAVGLVGLLFTCGCGAILARPVILILMSPYPNSTFSQMCHAPTSGLSFTQRHLQWDVSVCWSFRTTHTPAQVEAWYQHTGWNMGTTVDGTRQRTQTGAGLLRLAILKHETARLKGHNETEVQMRIVLMTWLSPP